MNVHVYSSGACFLIENETLGKRDSTDKKKFNVEVSREPQEQPFLLETTL